MDELKRQEVSRLRTLIKAKQDLEGGNGMQSCLLDAVYSLIKTTRVFASKWIHLCMLGEHAKMDPL